MQAHQRIIPKIKQKPDAGTERKLEFFDDIKNQLFLFLGGVISLTTIIPAFLNNTSQIFGFAQINYGYYLFVLLYFIAPYLFYLFYCSIHDDVGYLELLPDKALSYLRKGKWLKTALDIALPLGAFFVLIFPVDIVTWVVGIAIYGGSVFCFVYFAWAYRNEKELLKEFLTIGTILILTFTLFFANIIHKTNSYSMARQKAAFQAYAFGSGLQHEFGDLLDSTRKMAYQYRMQAESMHPGIGNRLHNDDRCAPCHITEVYQTLQKIEAEAGSGKEAFTSHKVDLGKNIRIMLAYDQSLLQSNDTDLYRTDVIYNASVALFDYSVAVQKKLTDPVKTKWAALLKDLQFKSILWFQLLILLGLSLWFKMQVKLKNLRRYEVDLIPVIKDNLGQVKTMVLLLFTLIIPWFRQISEKNVQFERPFMNVNLTELANGKGITRTDPPVPVTPPVTPRDSTKHDATLKTPPPDLAKVYHDPFLDTINEHVKNTTDLIKETKKLINEQAKRTIGNPADRKPFN